MSVHIATSLNEAIGLLAEDPTRQVLAGGTDFMVEVNYRHRRPQRIVVIDRIPELRGWHRDGDHLVIGAAVTYTELQSQQVASLVPALAQAARTVGSPQIRNAGTLGGNVATASPAGDTLPILAALDATVRCTSADGRRDIGLGEFITGVKRTSLRPGELIESIRIPVLDGPQEFLKIGTRNAMVISVAGLALVIDTAGRTARVGLGSVAPTPVRADDAERFLASSIEWADGTITDEAVATAGDLVMAAAAPIDDQRGTAAYRRHAVGVLARRALRRAFPTPAPSLPSPDAAGGPR
jgi:CO/xanthine dehydrogenase FAD-binding subunit